MTQLFKVGQTVFCGFHQSATVIDKVYVDGSGEPRAWVTCNRDREHDPIIDGILFSSEEAWLKYEIKRLRERLKQHKERLSEVTHAV